MEAGSELQHRTRVNVRKGRSVWVSEHLIVTPDIQSRQNGSRRGRGRKVYGFTLGDLPRSVHDGKVIGDDDLMLKEKSDHLIVVMKPRNGGGAKGVTG
jgi:hypothetical protein